MPEEAKALMREKATNRLKWVETQLEGKQYLMGDDFSVADAYLFTVAELDQAHRHRHLRHAGPRRLHGARRGAAGGAGGA